VTGRYAIYFTPDDSSELGLFGATVLRRRSEDAGDWLNPELPVDFPQSSDWAERIKKPAHYGFHATMKAPFELAPGISPAWRPFAVVVTIRWRLTNNLKHCHN